LKTPQKSAFQQAQVLTSQSNFFNLKAALARELLTFLITRRRQIVIATESDSAVGVYRLG